MTSTPRPAIKSLRMSKGRARWLLHVADQGIARKRWRGGHASFHCERAGWTARAHYDPETGEIILHRPTITGEPPPIPPEGDALTPEGWHQLTLAVEFLPEAEAVLYLRGTEQAQQAHTARLLHELGRADAAAADFVPETMRLARLLMAISEADGADRLVVAAALWRCVAGFHARLAADSGDDPELAGASVLEAAIEGAALAEKLLREALRPRQTIRRRRPEARPTAEGAIVRLVPRQQEPPP